MGVNLEWSCKGCNTKRRVSFLNKDSMPTHIQCTVCDYSLSLRQLHYDDLYGRNIKLEDRKYQLFGSWGCPFCDHENYHESKKESFPDRYVQHGTCKNCHLEVELY